MKWNNHGDLHIEKRIYTNSDSLDISSTMESVLVDCNRRFCTRKEPLALFTCTNNNPTNADSGSQQGRCKAFGTSSSRIQRQLLSGYAKRRYESVIKWIVSICDTINRPAISFTSANDGSLGHFATSDFSFWTFRYGYCPGRKFVWRYQSTSHYVSRRWSCSHGIGYLLS